MDPGQLTIDIPTRATFGAGVRRGVAELAGRLGSRRVLVVASAAMLERPLVAELVGHLRDAGAGPRFFTDVRPNPDIRAVDECARRYASEAIDHVLGIGGGSALDEAKAIAMALATGKDTRTLLSSPAPLPRRPYPLTLVPTTSGTGSELSFGAILSDTERKTKLGLRGRNIAADYAFVDPELTFSAPAAVTAITGFDVLTHAVETWLSRRATVFTEGFSRQAVELVFAHLPRVCRQPDDERGRTAMSYASMVMGVGLAHSTTCLPHRLQYPVGAATDSSHAEGLAALYPAWLDSVAPFAAPKLAACASWIGIEDANGERAARKFVDAVLGLMDEIRLRPTLTQLGVAAAEIDGYLDRLSGDLKADPGDVSRDALARIYRNSL